MTREGGYARLRAQLAGASGDIVRRWADRYRASPWRLGRAADHELSGLVVPLLEHLSDALPDDDEPSGDPYARWHPGSQRLRELERTVAFAGASLAADGASGFDVAAALRALAETLADLAPERREELGALFQWLSAMALDSLVSASRQAERERVAEQLERGMQVLLVTPELPALVLVGDPSTETLDTVYGRLVMAIVRVGAPAAIVDVSGLQDAAAAAVIDCTGHFLGHRKVAAVEVLVVGFGSDTAERAWRRAAEDAGTALRTFRRFDDAVARGLERAGLQLSRRRSP